MNNLRVPKYQEGFLIPVAIFIIVALAGLGVAISQLSSHSTTAAVQEAVAIQALNAAESGAQYAMNQLLFDVNSKTAADTNCTTVNGASLDFTADGLNNCASDITCALSSNTGGTARVYDISSVGSCGAGDFETERTVAVRAIYE